MTSEDFELSRGSISEINSTDDNTSYFVSVISDQNKTFNTLQFPAVPIRQDNLSLWLDSSDSILKNAPYTLWVDATTPPVLQVTGTNDVLTWSCKIDQR